MSLHHLYAEYAAVRAREEAEDVSPMARLLAEMARAVRMRRSGEFDTHGDWYKEAVATLRIAGVEI